MRRIESLNFEVSTNLEQAEGIRRILFFDMSVDWKPIPERDLVSRQLTLRGIGRVKDAGYNLFNEQQDGVEASF
jgi:hypothetical protein